MSEDKPIYESFSIKEMECLRHITDLLAGRRELLKKVEQMRKAAVQKGALGPIERGKLQAFDEVIKLLKTGKVPK